MRSGSNNAMLVIQPYCDNGVWKFDDDRVDPFGKRRRLVGEPFVGDINRMIDIMVEEAGVRRPRHGFTAYFSDRPFPGHHMVMKKEKAAYGGTDYSAHGMTGWLCPALFAYFAKAPERIYVRAESIAQPWWARLLPCLG